MLFWKCAFELLRISLHWRWLCMRMPRKIIKKFSMHIFTRWVQSLVLKARSANENRNARLVCWKFFWDLSSTRFSLLFIFFSIAIKFFLFSFSCGIFADRHIHFTHTLYLPFLYCVHQISNEKLSVIAIFAMASVPVRFLCSGAPVSETNVIYND